MTDGALFSVIPAGGSGTRLWPLSRAANPKFLHALTGSPASLLQATVERLAPLSTPDSIYVVTGAAHAAAVARQLPELPEVNLLVEPSPRDSCAAIGLAAAVIARRDPQAVMGSFAADHLVRDEAEFVATIRAAVEGARDGKLMTVGITPTHPETGYGYLECGEPCGGAAGPLVRAVTTFKEKPSLEVAQSYVDSGGFLWNASMFVWRVDVFLAELARQQPSLHAGVLRLAAAVGTSQQDDVFGKVWPRLPKISVDHAVMEGAADAGLVATVPGDFGWTDVGDFATLAQVFATQDPPDTDIVDASGNVVLSGERKRTPVLLQDTTNSVVVARSGRLVATLGVRDVVVVDTEDALLVCARDRAQDIKATVDELRRLGKSDYL